MHFDSIPADHILTILGAPRSGTTWLAKMLDSHPDVLYRHEPDWLLLEETRHVFATAAAEEEYRQAIRAHFYDLAGNNRLKSSGSLPRFQKSYRSGVTDLLHAGFTYALRGADKATGGQLNLRNVRVPDLFDPRAYPNLHVVVKSVSFQLRARQLAEALPGSRVLFIVRDPYGQVASMLRGAALGKFERPVNLETMANTEQAHRYGLTVARLENMSAVERYSWHWAIYNEMTYDDIEGLADVCTVRYDTLCQEPAAQARRVLAFAGLNWNPQTEAFIERSTRASLADGYYQVFKDPAATLNRWRTQLDIHDQARIHNVIAATTVGSLWLQTA